MLCVPLARHPPLRNKTAPLRTTPVLPDAHSQGNTARNPCALTKFSSKNFHPIFHQKRAPPHMRAARAVTREHITKSFKSSDTFAVRAAHSAWCIPCATWRKNTPPRASMVAARRAYRFTCGETPRGQLRYHRAFSPNNLRIIIHRRARSVECAHHSRFPPPPARCNSL